MNRQDLENTAGTVFNIQKFCTDDGPGIRTTVFLKGCPLRCAWCHNPEGLSREPILEYSQVDCAACRRCQKVCPNGVHSFPDGEHRIDRTRCVLCGKCAAECGFGALSLCGRAMTAAQVLENALADRAFYEPDGGITVSGGEPLLQPDFVLALGTLAKEAGIHFCVETSGAVAFSVLEKVLPVVDLFLFDIKETDCESHMRHTQVSNALPLANIQKLSRRGKAVLMRCPIIPGVNDRPSHFSALAGLYASLDSAVGIQIMPYHRMGQGKTTRYGVESRQFRVPEEAEIAGWNRMLENAVAAEVGPRG